MDSRTARVVKLFMTRHRTTIQDLCVLLAIMLVAAFLAFEFDIYANENSATVREQTIELDEALTLGGLLCVCLLIFALRRYSEAEARNLLADSRGAEYPETGLPSPPNRSCEPAAI
jgi:hypothetical protein